MIRSRAPGEASPKRPTFPPILYLCSYTSDPAEPLASRFRVGPFASEDKAWAEAARLYREGFCGAVEKIHLTQGKMEILGRFAP